MFNVSNASIHNWIKEGILKTTDGLITQRDINDFKRNYLNDRLSSRANKQYKQQHDHTLLTAKVNDYLSFGMSAEDVAGEYESSLSDSYKNKEGIYYTPQYIVEDMMKDVAAHDGMTFMDPCCGSGVFIIEALKRGFSPENVYGFDTDENAVRITKKRIKELCGYESENIVCADFLKEASVMENKIDYIFTNPPWGKKINKLDKKNYSLIYKSGNSIDSSALFYFACLKALKKDAVLGMLLPDSFFNITTFEDARKSLLTFKINKFIDYGKPFNGLITKAIAFVAKLSDKSLADNLIDCEVYNGKSHHRTQGSFMDIPKHILNFHVDEKSSALIRQVYSKPHITLKDNAIWALGIITGNNKKICSENAEEGSVPIFRGKDIHKDGLSKPTLFIDETLKGCRQVAAAHLYKAPEKIIYRFISDKIVCFHDTEQRYILNSANLFILNHDFPISHRQLAELLSSDFMNWLFKSIFNTHKILRSDLELLPIWHEYFVDNKEFSEETLMKYLKV